MIDLEQFADAADHRVNLRRSLELLLEGGNLLAQFGKARPRLDLLIELRNLPLEVSDASLKALPLCGNGLLKGILQLGLGIRFRFCPGLLDHPLGVLERDALAGLSPS